MFRVKPTPDANSGFDSTGPPAILRTGRPRCHAGVPQSPGRAVPNTRQPPRQTCSEATHPQAPPWPIWPRPLLIQRVPRRTAPSSARVWTHRTVSAFGGLSWSMDSTLAPSCGISLGCPAARLCLLLGEPLCLGCSVPQSCPTRSDPTNHSPPRSSVHGDSPGKNTGVGCHALLQGIIPTQEANPGIWHCRRILYRLSQQGPA